MSTEQMREAFERWASDNGYHLQREEENHDRYHAWVTNTMWIGWQAALTAPAAEVPVPEAINPDYLRDLAVEKMGHDKVPGWLNFAQSILAARDAQWQSTRLRGGVPEGWKLVPVEPPREMMEAGEALPPIVDSDMRLRRLGWSLMACQNRRRYLAMLTAAPQAPAAALDAGVARDARAEFEAMNRDSYGFKCSPRGTYRNPPVARDWKWFQAGIDFAKKGGQR